MNRPLENGAEIATLTNASASGTALIGSGQDESFREGCPPHLVIIVRAYGGEVAGKKPTKIG